MPSRHEPPVNLTGGFCNFSFKISRSRFSPPFQLTGEHEEFMEEESMADNSELLDAGIALGQTNAFALIAGRCSAAQAEGIRRLREQKLYKRCTEKWEDFCPKYLKMSRVEADRTVRLLEEFGPTYFELSQLTRVSPETYRAIAPQIQNGVLHHNGEAIELNVENSRKVAAAVAEMRSAIPRKSTESSDLARELNDLLHESDVQERISKLAQCCFTIVAEFEKIARDERLGVSRIFFQSTLTHVRDEMVRVAFANGL
jgi:hypothetical protein